MGENEQPVEALGSDGADPSFAEGVGTRRPDGDADNPKTSVANTSSKEPQNLASRSWMRNRSGCARWSRWNMKFLACWVTQALSGVGCATGEMNATSGELDEHQRVDPFEPHRLDREEITRHHARSLLGENTVAMSCRPAGEPASSANA